MPTTEQMPATAWGACTKIVEAATRSCHASPIAAPSPSSDPNWDALANSFAALSSAFAWGSIILAVAGILAGLAWGRAVALKAENEARTEAKKCADELIAKWLAEEAPGIIRAHLDALGNASLGKGDDDEAADDIGKEAG